MSNPLIHNLSETSQPHNPTNQTDDVQVQTPNSHGRKWSFLSAVSLLNPKIAVPATIGWALSKLPFAQAQYHYQCAETGIQINNVQNLTLHVEFIAKTAAYLRERSACCNEILPTLEQIEEFLEASCSSSMKMPAYHWVTKKFDVDQLTSLVLTIDTKFGSILTCVRDGLSGTHNIETIKSILSAFWTPCMDQKIEESERSLQLILICLGVGLTGAIIGGWYAAKKYSAQDAGELDSYERNIAYPPGALEAELRELRRERERAQQEQERERARQEIERTPQEVELQVLNIQSAEESI